MRIIIKCFMSVLQVCYLFNSLSKKETAAFCPEPEFLPSLNLKNQPFITASMSSMERGIIEERFSHPPSVIRQLSSRRKPIPHASQ